MEREGFFRIRTPRSICLVPSPSFKEVPEVFIVLDDESVKNEADVNVVDNTVNNEGEESDSEASLILILGILGTHKELYNDVDQPLNDKELLKPFHILRIYLKHKKEVGNSVLESSIPYTPGLHLKKVNVTLKQKHKNSRRRIIRSLHHSIVVVRAFLRKLKIY
ncbi:hypothetical protein Tco_1345901 [Tanacetum coccineum]